MQLDTDLRVPRRFSFENIAAALQQIVHRTVMEINLTAIVHNLMPTERF
jgi:alanine racemase